MTIEDARGQDRDGAHARSAGAVSQWLRVRRMLAGMNLLPLVRRVFGAEQISGVLLAVPVWEMPEAFDVGRGRAA